MYYIIILLYFFIYILVPSNIYKKYPFTRGTYFCRPGTPPPPTRTVKCSNSTLFLNFSINKNSPPQTANRKQRRGDPAAHLNIHIHIPPPGHGK